MPALFDILQTPDIVSTVQILCGIVLSANALSFLARHHWFFDLFSHFKIQYLLLSIILAILSLISGQIVLSLVVAIAALCIYMEVQSAYDKNTPLQTNAPNFKLIQYNKFYFNKRYNSIAGWLKEQENDADVMLVNEPLEKDIEHFKALKDVFPHQYPETFSSQFQNLLILSKYPLNVEKSLPGGPEKKRHYYTFKLKKPGLKEISLYAFHASVPAGKSCSERRNQSLRNIGAIIKSDTSDNIIFAGDWNITPFSPYFKDTLSISGLKTAKTSHSPCTTWPTFAFFSLFKIPIDHVLFSEALKLVKIKKGPALGSDHHPLIALFIIGEETPKNMGKH